jgi:hypothetical protein
VSQPAQGGHAPVAVDQHQRPSAPSPRRAP